MIAVIFPYLHLSCSEVLVVLCSKLVPLTFASLQMPTLPLTYASGDQSGRSSKICPQSTQQGHNSSKLQEHDQGNQSPNLHFNTLLGTQILFSQFSSFTATSSYHVCPY